MPKTCKACQFCWELFPEIGAETCMAANKSLSDYNIKTDTERAHFCPLIEVKQRKGKLKYVGKC